MLENLLKSLPKSVIDALKAFLESLVKEIGDAEVYTPEESEVIKHSVVVGDAIEYWIKLL